MTLTETNRLIIRNWTTDDVDAYAQIVADPEVMEHIGNSKTFTYEEAEKFVNHCRKQIEERGWSRFAVETKDTHELAGFCGFEYRDHGLDFGWRYARKFWNKGYGTEAAKAVLDLGLHQFKFPEIVCIAYPENVASVRIIEKLGFQFEKHITLYNRKVVQYVMVNGNVGNEYRD